MAVGRTMNIWEDSRPIDKKDLYNYLTHLQEYFLSEFS